MRQDDRVFKRWLIPVAIMLVLAVIAAVYLLGSEAQSNAPPGQTGAIRPPTQPKPTQPAWEGTQPPTTDPVETTEPTEMTIPEEPADDDLQIWEPPAETDPPEEILPTEEPLPPEEPVQTDMILCRRYARFSGQYVEDGRDELVEHVAAILVTNESDQFLDLATITYDIDGETAVFIVTGLPAGRSAWVMESTRMVIRDDAVFTRVETVTSFRDGVEAQTGEITLSADANMLTAVNNTDRTLENVFVYYKTLHTDGNFFGGITYRVEFGTLEPGCAAEALAGHYSGDSEIVRIGWTEQE